MNLEELLLWCLVMLPLIVSPGPANLSVAGVSASRGFKAAMVFISGIMVVNCVVTTLMGLGMGLVYVKYYSLFFILERLGALYIVYLGITIFRSNTQEGQSKIDGKSLKVSDGMLMQVLNPKLYPSLTMMFSQFIDGDASTSAEVLILSVLMLCVVFVNYIGWALMGSALNRSEHPWARWIQSYGFGSMLIIVGGWLFFH